MHQPIDDHFLLKYRALLDAEDLAFDELEHACEEGDRMQFDKDMVDWQNALEHKLALPGQRRDRGQAARSGLAVAPPSGVPAGAGIPTGPSPAASARDATRMVECQSHLRRTPPRLR